MRLTAAIIAAAFALETSARGAAFQPGNLLISTNEKLFEFAIDGTPIQTLSIPYPDVPRPSTEAARDIATDERGNVHVYNGTFDPVLSTFDPRNGTWQHRSIQGWSTVNNGSYGGIGVVDGYVFLTDMRTYGDGDLPQGLIRYDLATSTSTRFATDIEPIDLTIGLDGFLYALYPGGSPGGRYVAVYEPLSLDFVKTISLADIFGHTEHRSIAVDAAGAVFVADWDGEVQKIDADGHLLGYIDLPETLYDIDLSPTGRIAIGSRNGDIFITDEGFSTPFRFRAGNEGAFVGFVVVPEPAAYLALSMFPILIGTLHARRLKMKRTATAPWTERPNGTA